MTPSRKSSVIEPVRLLGAFIVTLIIVCLALPARSASPEALETRWLGAILILAIGIYVVLLASPKRSD